jgi:intergrase/recombinase
MDLVSISGLRFIEAIEGYNLISKLDREGKLNTYYNSEREALEHFRFNNLFIRRTKKAFISFVPKTLVDAISRNKPLTVNSVQSRVRKRNLNLRFSDVREAHGTFLTKYLR